MKVVWVLDHLGRRNAADVTRNAFHQQLAQMPLCSDDNQYNQTWEAAAALRNTVATNLMPWHDFGPTTTKEAAGMLNKAYVEEFGNPEDPEFAAEVDRALEWLKGTSNAG